MLSEKVDATRKISVAVDSVPIRRLLDVLSKSHGLTWNEDAEGIVRVGLSSASK